jgi:tetratricopeptide (TPR) repeat protein
MLNPIRILQRAALVALACAAAGAWTCEARAGGPANADAAGEEAAKLFRQGNAAFEQKKWAEAEASYEKAWQLAHTFDVAANLGEVLLQLGRPREAATYLAFSLRAAPPSAKAAQRERTRHFFDEAKKQVGAIRLRTNVADARATIDGAAVEPEDLPFEVFLEPGTHTIVAQRDGYQPARATIQVGAGSAQEVSLALARERRSVVPGAVLGGVAGVALVSGIGLFAAARGKRSTAQSASDSILQQHHSCVTGASNFDARCDDIRSTASTGVTLEHASVGLFVGAGAAAAGAVLYFAWPQGSATASARSAWRIVPSLSPSALGFAASGTF